MRAFHVECASHSILAVAGSSPLWMPLLPDLQVEHLPGSNFLVGQNNLSSASNEEFNKVIPAPPSAAPAAPAAPVPPPHCYLNPLHARVGR